MMHRHSFLFLQWLRRDLESRYRGSVLGLAWPVLQPVAQTLVFTLVFHRFMQMRWPATSGAGAFDYAINAFAGLAVFNFFAEVLGRAPSAVLSQPSLVTKVRFPVALLPTVTVGAAALHLLIGGSLVVLATIVQGHPVWTALLLPLICVPILLYGLGLSWMLAAVGVYLRDVGQLMPPFIGLLMFLTPVFYPASAIPAALRGLVDWNPVGWSVEAFRELAISGALPDPSLLFAHALASLLLAMLARRLFVRLERGFADAL